MLNIRLARTGRKRDPHFRVVVSDSVRGRVGRIVETVGYYHPRRPKDAEDRLHLEADRVRYWLGHGAQPSLTVKSFLRNLSSEPAAAPEAAPEPAAAALPAEAASADTAAGEEAGAERAGEASAGDTPDGDTADPPAPPPVTDE